MPTSEAVAAALRFAKRRRIGPFADARPRPKEREKALAAMIRAGHPFALAREIMALAPGSEIDLAELAERSARRDKVGLPTHRRMLMEAW